MAQPNQQLLQKLPSVDKILLEQQMQARLEHTPRRVIVDGIRAAVDHTRQLLLSGSAAESTEDALRCAILDRAAAYIDALMNPHYHRVINAAGIILHTALGRAVLAPQAIRQIEHELAGYSLLQVDLETGRRCPRDNRIEQLLCQITGAPAATVVNNNAAATVVGLNTVAAGREVIVSRGQLIEIGGSFRLPEVMAAAGVRLVEVGTTNKTHPRDYEKAITENTAALLRVHPSNYKITGFTSEVPLGEMKRIAAAHNLVLIDDVGAGALIDFSRFGFEYEPTLMDSIAAGADVVTSSADKLIGAAQGGIILGRKEIIQAVRKNPWARIVRVDKLTLAALEATLRLFLDESFALREVPTLAMLSRSLPDIEQQVRRIVQALQPQSDTASITVIDGFSQMGSGSLPTQNLPTYLVAVHSPKISADELARRLRLYRTPIIARIQDGQVLLDPRTLLPGDEPIVIQALQDIFAARP
ncbi:MAG: L-seryl-tRNA(Sec) selenium transferase [Planctomycetes bacterium ADurb.Bin412]|nr:MAG: L-seryl-tRNA(Sec) selenium transferase [Planctomycetes bacterium ADurb.Bin412]